MEIRETYYEVYFDGQLEHQGNLEECTELALHALDDDLAEVYEVVVSENKVVI
tara:strand:+ start:157 stop:315 length:159 start_codon:yes stop_codon:yes gene_type:complete